MLIKPIARLKPSDLPFAESPDLAVRFVKRKHNSQSGLRLSWSELIDIPGLISSACPDQAFLKLISALEKGQLFLVFDPASLEGPLAPLAVCDATGSSPAGGGWVPGIAEARVPGLRSHIASLNRHLESEQETRGRQGAGGKNSSNALSLPLGASLGMAKSLTPSQPKLDSGEPKKPLTVNLTIGLFTDGTLNNFDNIQEFRERVQSECTAPMQDDVLLANDCQKRLALLMGESYANQPTNIVKLYGLYSEGKETKENIENVTFKIYQSGVGTQSSEQDSIVGMSTGLGATGVQSQIRKAFKRIAARARLTVGFAQVAQMNLDLFGFSRGAAASRYAANEIKLGRNGLLGEAFRKEGLFWPDQIKIRFMGLFDTVAAIVNPFVLDFSAGNSSNLPINIGLQSSDVGKVVHLCAADECRANFALNSVQSSNDICPKNFREVFLPGAHSDVGGGYSSSQLEDLLLYPPLIVTGRDTRWPKKTTQWDNLETIRSVEIGKNWIGLHSLPLEDGGEAGVFLEESQDQHPLPDGRVEFRLKMRRQVEGGLSSIAMHIMHELAIKEGVPFLPEIEGADDQVPVELGAIHRNLLTQVLNGESRPVLGNLENEWLKQRYVHHSHHFNFFEFIAWDDIALIEPPFRSLYPSKPSDSNRRLVHWNKVKD